MSLEWGIDHVQAVSSFRQHSIKVCGPVGVCIVVKFLRMQQSICGKVNYLWDSWVLHFYSCSVATIYPPNTEISKQTTLGKDDFSPSTFKCNEKRYSVLPRRLRPAVCQAGGHSKLISTYNASARQRHRTISGYCSLPTPDSSGVSWLYNS